MIAQAKNEKSSYTLQQFIHVYSVIFSCHRYSLLPSFVHHLCLHAVRPNFHAEDVTNQMKQGVYGNIMLAMTNEKSLEEVIQLLQTMESIKQLGIDVTYCKQQILIYIASQHIPPEQRKAISIEPTKGYQRAEVEQFFQRYLTHSPHAYDTMSNFYVNSSHMDEAKHNELLELAKLNGVKLLHPSGMYKIASLYFILHRFKSAHSFLPLLSRSCSFVPYSPPPLSLSSSHSYIPLVLAEEEQTKLSIEQKTIWHEWNECIGKIEQLWYNVQQELISSKSKGEETEEFQQENIADCFNTMMKVYQCGIEHHIRAVQFFQQYYDWHHPDYKLGANRYLWKADAVWYLMAACARTHIQNYKYAYKIYMRIHNDDIQLLNDNRWTILTDQAIWGCIKHNPAHRAEAMKILTLASDKHNYVIQDIKLAERLLVLTLNDSSLSSSQLISQCLFIVELCDRQIKLPYRIHFGIIELAFKRELNNEHFNGMHALIKRVEMYFPSRHLSSAYLYFIGICAKAPEEYRERAIGLQQKYLDMLLRMNALHCDISEKDYLSIIELLEQSSFCATIAAQIQLWFHKRTSIQQPQQPSQMRVAQQSSHTCDSLSPTGSAPLPTVLQSVTSPYHHDHD